jgi:hypothetical protein
MLSMNSAHHAATSTVEYVAQREMVHDENGEVIPHDDRPVEGPARRYLEGYIKSVVNP